jgi:hypothetical protein
MLTDSLVSQNANHLLKYADDTTLAGKLKTSSDSNSLNQSLLEINKWSSENSLILNRTKCVECLFRFRNSRPRQQFEASSSIDGISLSEVTDVKYLGIHFSSDCTWSLHIQSIFSKCLKLSFVIKRLVLLQVPYAILRKFVDACVLPVILYCSPVVYSGLLGKDVTVLRRAMKMISRASGLPYQTLVDVITCRHLDASTKFAKNILADPQHPLHDSLLPSVSTSSTRSSYNLIYSRTSSFRRSVIPFLARVLTDISAESNRFKQLLL